MTNKIIANVTGFFSISRRGITKFVKMERHETQWMPVIAWCPMYMGRPHGDFRGWNIPRFVSREDSVSYKDGDGWDVDGNTAGYWRVWDSFVEFQREYPGSTFTDTGYILVP